MTFPSDPARIGRIVVGLQTIWAANPSLTFGQMIEKVEDVAWRQLEAVMMREYSARWSNLPDAFMEGAVDECVKKGTL